MRTAEGNQVPVLTILFAVFTVAGVYLSGQVIYHLRDLLMLGLVGGFIALILNPVVVALQHWRVKRRGGAVAIVTFVALLVFLGLAVLFGYPLINGITHFAHALPGYVRQAQHGKGWIGHLFRKYHVENWVKKNSSHLTSLATGLSKPALALGKGALSAILSLIFVFTFVVLLLIEAPKIRRSLTKMVSPERAKRYRHIGRIISRSVSGYVLGDMLTSIAAGVVVFVTLLIIGVPYAFLWALWVALVDFLPTIGGALAGFPTVLFAFAHSLSRGHRDARRLPRLHPSRESHLEPDRHEPDRQDQSAARVRRGLGRCRPRFVGRGTGRRLRRGPARRADGRHHSGHRARVVARERTGLATSRSVLR